MPTFHHWRAGKQRNGLTFQTAADARAFDKGIIKAYDDLIDGKRSADVLTPQSFRHMRVSGACFVSLLLDRDCH
jgi:hypothetical protein